MRLIEATTLCLKEFYGDSTPPYAILSHTWGDNEVEVTFKDWEDLPKARRKAGFAKIEGACSKALEHGLEWVWADTNCIDKSSSAELSEAINSMFEWYARSEICYAYLADVSSARADDQEILASRWFTRGWTLQELVAPRRVTFYAADWSKLGSRDGSLATLVSGVTGINREYVEGVVPVQRACVAQKMSWLAKRKTTRPEDMAYCMLGLFGINMPLLYGEGSKAFSRLQHEIIRTSNDHTIFCWTWTPSVPDTWTSLLAPSPRQFEDAGIFRPPSAGTSEADEVSIYSMTNAGLSIRLPIIYALWSYFVVLQAAPVDQYPGSSVLSCIQVRGGRRGDSLYVSRVPNPKRPINVAAKATQHLQAKQLLVMNAISDINGQVDKKSRWRPIADYPGQFAVVLAFDSETLSTQWAALRKPSKLSYPEDALHPFRSTVTLVPTGPASGPWIGAALVPLNATIRTGPIRHMYIFVAAKIYKSKVRWLCQIFASRLDDQPEMNGLVLEDLRHQVRQLEQEQPGHYSRTLGLSAIIDSMHPLQNDRHNSFLRISEGRRTDWFRDTGKLHDANGDDADGDDGSGAESVDSNAAIALSTQFKERPLPTRGAFHVPMWE